MTNIKKTLVAFLISCAVLSGVGASVALADSWTSARHVKLVYVRTMSGTPILRVVSSDGNWGGPCRSTAAERKADDRIQDHMVSVATSAYLSGKRLKLYTNDSCKITRMQILD